MNRLRQLREERNITQSDLAEYLNSNYQTISDYERGKYYPGIDILKILARYFNTSIDYLLEITDLRDPYASASEQHFTPKETELIGYYRELDVKGQEKLLGIALGMKEVQKL